MVVAVAVETTVHLPLMMARSRISSVLPQSEVAAAYAVLHLVVVVAEHSPATAAEMVEPAGL